MLLTVFDYLVLLITAGIMGKLIEGFLFLIVYSSIRSQAGGYHAKTKMGCLLEFLLAFMIALTIPDHVQEIPAGICLMIGVVVYGVLLKWSPVESIGVPICETAKKHMRNRALVILSLWLIGGIIMYLSGIKMFQYILLAVIWIGIVLIIGKIKLSIYTWRNKNDNEQESLQ